MKGGENMDFKDVKKNEEKSVLEKKRLWKRIFGDKNIIFKEL